MSTEIPHFDYDQLSDNVRVFVRSALCVETGVANALTMAQGEALVQKLTATAVSEARKMLQPYLEQVEAILDGVEKAAADPSEA